MTYFWTLKRTSPLNQICFATRTHNGNYLEQKEIEEETYVNNVIVQSKFKISFLSKYTLL